MPNELIPTESVKHYPVERIASAAMGESEYVIFGRCGLAYKDSTPIEVMIEHASRVGSFVHTTRQLEWIVGDMLLEAERIYGQKWAQIFASMENPEMTVFGVSIQYGRNAMWIAGKFSPPIRRDKLTPGHHKAVVPLLRLNRAAALQRLDKAIENKTSAADLRAEINAYIKRAKELEDEGKKKVVPSRYLTEAVTWQFAANTILEDYKEWAGEDTDGAVVEFLREWRPE